MSFQPKLACLYGIELWYSSPALKDNIFKVCVGGGGGV